MSLPLDYLWSQILRCPTERVCVPIPDHALLAETEIGQFDVPILIQQDIFRFQVPIYDTILVQTLEGKENLSRVEDSAGL